MVMVLYLRASLGVKWSFLKMHGRKKNCNIHISGMSGTSLMHRRWGLPKKWDNVTKVKKSAIVSNQQIGQNLTSTKEASSFSIMEIRSYFSVHLKIKKNIKIFTNVGQTISAYIFVDSQMYIFRVGPTPNSLRQIVADLRFCSAPTRESCCHPYFLVNWHTFLFIFRWSSLTWL